jgi:hypothetical protein
MGEQIGTFFGIPVYEDEKLNIGDASVVAADAATIKGWVSRGELYPAYYLTLETDPDYTATANNDHRIWGHEIRLTPEEYADLRRAWEEWSKWQDRLSGGDSA